MTYDKDYRFSNNNDLLVEVTQFISQLNNSMLSNNENCTYSTNSWIQSFNDQLREELKEYKVYDC